MSDEQSDRKLRKRMKIGKKVAHFVREAVMVTLTMMILLFIKSNLGSSESATTEANRFPRLAMANLR